MWILGFVYGCCDVLLMVLRSSTHCHDYQTKTKPDPALPTPLIFFLVTEEVIIFLNANPQHKMTENRLYHALLEHYKSSIFFYNLIIGSKNTEI